MTDNLPESIIVAGAGAIGVEFAYVMTNYGVKVTIVEFLDRMVPLEDAEISAELAKAYKQARSDRADRHQGRDDRRLRRQGQGHRLAGRPAGTRRCWRPTRCCRRSASRRGPRATAWRTPASTLTERGAIDIDDYMRTNVDGIYAIGDCTAKLMLAHLAEAQGIVAAETIAGAETMPIDYDMVPRATYCQPQIGSLRLLRGAGQGQGVRGQDRQVPLHRQRQGARARRRRPASSSWLPTPRPTSCSAPA